jgi:hypothetical protein
MALRRMAGSCSTLLLHARVASADVPAAVQLVSVAVFRWDNFNNRSSRNACWPHNNLYGDLFAHSFATKTGPQSDKQLISELPDAKDCDEVLGDYDSLRIKYAKIGYPPTYKPWPSRLAEFSKAAGRFTLSAVHFVVMVPSYIFRAITMPAAERSARLASMWKTIKHEAHHYWMGTKVLRPPPPHHPASLASCTLSGGRAHCRPSVQQQQQHPLPVCLPAPIECDVSKGGGPFSGPLHPTSTWPRVAVELAVLARATGGSSGLLR